MDRTGTTLGAFGSASLVKAVLAQGRNHANNDDADVFTLAKRAILQLGYSAAIATPAVEATRAHVDADAGLQTMISEALRLHRLRSCPEGHENPEPRRSRSQSVRDLHERNGTSIYETTPGGSDRYNVGALDSASLVKAVLAHGRTRKIALDDADVFTLAKRAIVQLGYSAAIATPAVEATRAHVDADAGLPTVIREALRRCTG